MINEFVCLVDENKRANNEKIQDKSNDFSRNKKKRENEYGSKNMLYNNNNNNGNSNCYVCPGQLVAGYFRSVESRQIAKKHANRPNERNDRR